MRSGCLGLVDSLREPALPGQEGSDASAESDWAVDYLPATALYRRACAMAHQSRRRANQYQETGQQERRLREIDAAVEAVILGQGAAEGWIFNAYRRAGVAPRPGANWREVWRSAIDSINPELGRELSGESSATLDWLSAWRNYLVHDDDRARRNLKAAIGVDPHLTLVTAQLAEEVIRRCDAAFADVGAAIGSFSGSAPNSAFLWIAEDEV